MKSSITKKISVIVLLLFVALFLSGCGVDDTQPIEGIQGVLDLLVLPMAGLLWVIAKTVAFGNYGIALIIATIIVRTLAWPIYAKTNDMSLKMQLIGPEQAKIQEKYAGKEDPASKQAMQMETSQLYKKYGLGLGGCLMPFVQFPIFISFYSVVRRLPVTPWLNDVMSFNFFGISLAEKAVLGNWDWQTIGVYILAFLVGATQIFSQILIQRRQKKMKEAQTANLPDYRKPQQTPQQQSTEKTMKYMIYFMTIMMVVFVVQSPAALGLYWLIGNLYSTFQSYISHKNSSARIESLKKKHI